MEVASLPTSNPNQLVDDYLNSINQAPDYLTAPDFDLNDRLSLIQDPVMSTTLESEYLAVIQQCEKKVGLNRERCINNLNQAVDEATKTMASKMIKTLYGDGATSVTNIAFSSTNKEEVEQEAREDAVKNAKANAKRIAKASGKRLGRVVLIKDDNKAASGTVSSNKNSTTSEFSNVSISKIVSIIYEVW